VRPRTGAEIDHGEQCRVFGIGRVEHGDAPGHVHRDEQPLAVVGHSDQLGPTALRDRGEVEHRNRPAGARFDQIELVVQHPRGVRPRVAITGNEFDVDGATSAGHRDRLQNRPRRQRPHPDTPAKIEVAGHRMKGRRRADEVARHHQVQLWPHRNPVRVESIVGRVSRVLADQAQVAVEFGDASRVMSRRPAIIVTR
jgi:hypothetical protein